MVQLLRQLEERDALPFMKDKTKGRNLTARDLVSAARLGSTPEDKTMKIELLGKLMQMSTIYSLDLTITDICTTLQIKLPSDKDREQLETEISSRSKY